MVRKYFPRSCFECLWFFALLIIGISMPAYGAGKSLTASEGSCPFAATGVSVSKAPTTFSRRMADDSGRGDWPYNSRLIDEHLLAGGTPFHPQTPPNSSEHVKKVLERVRKLGMQTVVILNVPVDDRDVHLEEKIAADVGLKTIRLSMNAEKVPTASETIKLLEVIEDKAYVHCQWGADRTGAVVAKYLRARHGYSGRSAWEAVIKGGSHAGRLGGLKVDPRYANLLLYFWPEVVKSDPEVCQKYGLKYLEHKK